MNDFQWERFLRGEVKEVFACERRRARRAARQRRRRRVRQTLVSAAIIAGIVMAGAVPVSW